MRDLQERLDAPAPAAPRGTIKTIKSPSFFSEQVTVVYHVLQRYQDPMDWLALALAAAKRPGTAARSTTATTRSSLLRWACPSSGRFARRAMLCETNRSTRTCVRR